MTNLKTYFKDANVILFCVNASNPEGFKKAEELYVKHCQPLLQTQRVPVPVYLILTKCENEVDMQLAQQFAAKYNMVKDEIFCTSAKNNTNVQALKSFVTQACLQHQKAIEEYQAMMKENPLLAMLDDKLTINKVQDFLSDKKDSLQVMDLLEQAFLAIKAAPENKLKPRTSLFFTMHNAEYSDKQLHNIEILKKAYYQYIEDIAMSNLVHNPELKEKASKSELIDFQQTTYEMFVKDHAKTRDRLAKIL